MSFAGVESDSLARGKWPKMGATVAYKANCVGAFWAGSKGIGGRCGKCGAWRGL